MTTRENSLGLGAHEYALTNGNTARRMGGGDWYIFDCAGNDTGRSYPTLRAARAGEKERASRQGNA